MPFLQAIYLQCSKLGANKCIEKTTNVQSGCFQIRESERKSSESYPFLSRNLHSRGSPIFCWKQGVKGTYLPLIFKIWKVLFWFLQYFFHIPCCLTDRLPIRFSMVITNDSVANLEDGLLRFLYSAMSNFQYFGLWYTYSPTYVHFGSWKRLRYAKIC